jgi:hypothetical protein
MAEVIGLRLERPSGAKKRKPIYDALLKPPASAVVLGSVNESMKNATGSEQLFVDNWGWLVLANDDDPSFAAVAGLRRRSIESGQLWVNTDYVLDETITRLFAAAPFPKTQSFAMQPSIQKNSAR